MAEEASLKFLSNFFFHFLVERRQLSCDGDQGGLYSVILKRRSA